jgi:hypothetical protein
MLEVKHWHLVLCAVKGGDLIMVPKSAVTAKVENMLMQRVFRRATIVGEETIRKKGQHHAHNVQQAKMQQNMEQLLAPAVLQDGSH